MTPIQFRIEKQRMSAGKKVRIMRIPESGNSVILPTPSSGITLREAGSWDETAGYGHAKTKQGLMDAFTTAAGKSITTGTGEMAAGFLFKGIFVNDYASLAYQGSNMREYTFGWDLTPSSEKEAIEIQNIIKLIRFYSLPNYNKTSNKGFVTYPYMWDIDPAIANPIDLAIKDCVITNFTVNYTPEGVLKTYRSGHPISVNIDITFKELYRSTDGDVINHNMVK